MNSTLFSYIADAAIAYIAVLIVVEYYVGGIQSGVVPTSPRSWTDIIMLFPTMCFAYQV